VGECFKNKIKKRYLKEKKEGEELEYRVKEGGNGV
jgi:hypothetical protein